MSQTYIGAGAGRRVRESILEEPKLDLRNPLVSACFSSNERLLPGRALANCHAPVIDVRDHGACE